MGQGGSEVALADVGDAGDPVAQHLLCARHCVGCLPGLLSPKITQPVVEVCSS